jgi:hypothetical protein
MEQARRRDRHAEPLKADRPSGVRLAGRDADLGAKAVAEAVGEARARVDKDAGRIDPAAEALHARLVLGDDRVGVFGRVVVDVPDGLGQRVDGDDRELGSEVLDEVRLGRRGHDIGVSRDRSEGAGVGVELDRLGEEGLCDGRPDSRKQGRVDDERLERVAGRHVVGLHAAG